MQLYYLLGLLLLGVVSCRHVGEQANKIDEDSSDEDFRLDPKSTAKFVEKCKEVAGEAASKKFLVAIEGTTACLNKEVPKSHGELKKEFIKNDVDEGICSKKRKTFRACFVDLIDAVKDCSHEEEKYAPEFLFDALDSLLDFICADDAKVVNDLIYANETEICVYHLFDKVFSGNMTYVCTENFKLIHHNEDDIISKPELCSDLATAKQCYSAFLKRECPNATELYNFVVGAFTAVSTPCKDVPLILTLETKDLPPKSSISV